MSLLVRLFFSVYADKTVLSGKMVVKSDALWNNYCKVALVAASRSALRVDGIRVVAETRNATFAKDTMNWPSFDIFVSHDDALVC